MDLNVEGNSARIPPGSHICQLYTKVDEIRHVTARPLHVGLNASARCLFAGPWRGRAAAYTGRHPRKVGTIKIRPAGTP